jgi:tetratricopeptide (TPR) repeat protein
VKKNKSLIMKRLSILLGLFISVGLILSSCGGLNKMKKNAGTIQYSVNPNPLEMHADSVALTITGKFPTKYFNKKVILTATPYLVGENSEKAFKPVTVQGEKVQDNYKVISYTDGGSFTYTDKIPYDEALRLSKLELRITAKKGNKSLDFDPVTIANGVIATPGLVKIDPKPIIGKDKFQRITTEEKVAKILFKIQQANLQPKELKKEEVQALLDYLEMVAENDRKELKEFDLSAYASPDGPQDLNDRLSHDRGKVTKKFLLKKFRKQQEVANDSVYNVQYTKEDWEGFKELMEASNLEDKDLVLRVLSMYSDPDQREKEIKNMSKIYTEIAEEILPQLRRSVMKVKVNNIGYSDDEIKSIYSTKPDSLKPEELLYAATLYNDNNKKLEVYKKFMEVYPNDWRGPNNAACMLIKLGNIDEAKQMLDKAKQLNENNPIIENNFGVVCLLKGNIDKAEEHFVAASGAGKEVNYNMGIIKIKKADYQGAVDAFGNDCNFNAALAKLLTEDYDGSIKTIDCAKDKDDAMLYYLKAIDGARKGDSDLLFNNLRIAVEKDAKLAKLAATDMEFEKYFNDDTFKSIVNK